MHYKALICDLDGTTIPNRHDGMPSDAVSEAITKAQEKLHVSTATARPYFFAEPIVRALDLTGPSIFHNGARIIDVTNGKLLWEQAIGHDETLAACEILKHASTHIIVNDDGDDFIYQKPYTPYKPLSVFINDIDPNLGKILLHELATIETISAHPFAGYKTNTIGIVVSHASATKQHAILHLAKLLGIETKDLIGVGDSLTDFPLLMACGLKVAMGNAVDDLKAIADYVAPSVEDDGVAEVIRKFVIHERQ